MAGAAVVYNGLVITPAQVRIFHRQPIWDGPAYLYTRYVLKVTGIFNPQYTAYAFVANAPVATPGALAYGTDNAIRHTLFQPRGVLAYYLAYGETDPRLELLSHDVLTYETDAKNGPTPIDCDVTQVIGKKTFIVTLTIETHVNECSKFVDSVALSNMLSHRWEQTDDLDEQFFTVRRTHGKAIFRSDRLIYSGFSADDFRGWLFPPCLDYFKRTGIKVRTSPDGLELEYWLTDTQQAFNLEPAWVDLGVTKLTCTMQQGITSRGLINFAADSLFFAGQSLAEVAHRIAQDVSRGGGSANPATAAAAVGSSVALEATSFAIGKATQAAKLLFDSVPKSHKVVSIKVWGNSDSRRLDLYNCGLRALMRLVSNNDLILSETGINVTQEMTGRFVQIDASVKMGPLANFTTAFSSFSLAKFPLPVLTYNDTIVGVTTDEVTDNPLPNGDVAGTRTAPEALTSAPLPLSCAVPENNNDVYPPDAAYGFPSGVVLGG